MTFEETALLLGLLGGAIFGTFQMCYILFNKTKKYRHSL